MLRSIGKQFLSTKNGSIFIPRNGIADSTMKRPMELNSVKLMGTIVDEVKYLNGGAIKLRLKTSTEDTSDCLHDVAIANRNLIKIVRNKLAPEQRIYIGGRLKTENTQIDDQYQQRLEIMALELFALEPNPKMTDTSLPVQMDENCVELLAFVGTSVWSERDLSEFSVMTHFVKQKGKPEECEGLEYHKILVYKDKKMKEFAQNLQKLDRIYLKGFINYSKDTFSNGSEYVNGFIQPTDLIKLQRFNE